MLRPLDAAYALLRTHDLNHGHEPGWRLSWTITEPAWAELWADARERDPDGDVWSPDPPRVPAGAEAELFRHPLKVTDGRLALIELRAELDCPYPGLARTRHHMHPIWPSHLWGEPEARDCWGDPWVVLYQEQDAELNRPAPVHPRTQAIDQEFGWTDAHAMTHHATTDQWTGEPIDPDTARQ